MTKQDQRLQQDLHKLNVALDSLNDVRTDFLVRKKDYQGATDYARYEKLINIISKHLNQISSERKTL